MKTLTLSPKHRYLTRFDPKRIPHSFTDVLIIGGGIAGLRAAMAIDPSLQTVVLSKDVLAQSNSAYAQGGIAGVLDPLDDFTNHIADTVAAGKGLCDAAIVEMVVREAPDLINELVGYGTQFDKEHGEIALTQEGGHSHRRVAHALGDATGKEIMRAMMQRIREREAAGAAQIWQETFVIDLLTHDGVCRGALVWNPRHGKTFVWAKQTILASGGAGRLYRETTNPEIATADGHAFSFRAGAALRDMEFVQFHPTVLYIAGSSRHLISEAVRGEGAFLRNSTGYRFMSDYDDAMELAPRDVVSRAITEQMENTRHPCVYLDLTHLDEELIGDRFPHIAKVCAEFGLDIARDLIPVRPGAHYMVGGLAVDSHGKTTLPGLWAAGEATSSGLHGANRLGSNSLLEGLFLGSRSGAGASQQASDEADRFSAIPLTSDWSRGTHDDDELDLLDIFNSLTSLMWRNVGIARDAEGLEKAEQQVGFWDRYVSEREFFEPHGWELQNMLLTARLIIAAATARTESRGVHFRSDFPDTNSAMQQHIAIIADHG